MILQPIRVLTEWLNDFATRSLGGGGVQMQRRLANAEGARIESPSWVGCGEGYPLPSRLGSSGERRELLHRPRPQTLLKNILGSQNGSGIGAKCDILPNVKHNFVVFIARQHTDA